ncbi:MAG TPA: sugar ABC transporter permease [Actinotalea caeni]|uniref:carbohydrate ABC transporter permease n=1 Tax=Actinotalea caeni TaxID=1348467 RepID=UPI002B4B0FDC|nr:sugar ABC transporter permease [Actinotalea caeni]HLV55626.1 sugar ABC transporter permease [Actinotalea caeni]
MNARQRAEARAGYLLLVPSFVGVGVFLLLPVLIVLALSFTRYNLLSAPQWAGLDNFVYLLGWERFRNSLWVTALFTLMTIPTSIVLGLLLAVAINRRLPGTSWLRVLYVLPWVCAPLALGVVWRWIFDPTNGALNALLGRRIEWLADVDLALPSVAFVQVWSSVGYISLFFLAGLQQIPVSVYEAAKLDGAGPVRTLWSITLPLLRPTMFFVTVTSIISSFQVFDTVYAMTGGGPRFTTDVIAARIYDEAFVALRLGRAAAMALVLFLLLVAVTLVQQRYFRRRVTYDMS